MASKNVRMSRQPGKPQIQVVDQLRRYQDTPHFGFDVVNVTVNGINVQVYRACNFVQTPNGQIARAIPVQGGFVCLSEAEADAFQQTVKAQATKPQLIVPGSAGFQKPPRLN